MTFLAIDVGNTRLKWALFAHSRPGAEVLAQGAVFLENIEKLWDEAWSNLSPPQHILGCIVANDSTRQRVQEQMESWEANAQWVVPNAAQYGLVNGYTHPARLGADRWVAMVGAWHALLQRGGPQPLLVVMVGTAVTVDAIDAQGHFLGGVILPGHGIMLRALESGTAALHVPTGQVCEFPVNTSDAITSGGTFAIAGAIERMAQHLRQRCGVMPVCMMSGGAGWKMAPTMSIPFELKEQLIFEGLLVMAEQRFLSQAVAA